MTPDPLFPVEGALHVPAHRPSARHRHDPLRLHAACPLPGLAHRRRCLRRPPARPLALATRGDALTGRARSQAWRTVGAAFDVPRTARRVVVGRDESAVADAASRLGWEEHATDWREVIAREDIDIVDICTPG